MVNQKNITFYNDEEYEKFDITLKQFKENNPGAKDCDFINLLLSKYVNEVLGIDYKSYEPEVITSEDLEFEKTCPWGFKKKIKDSNSKEHLWHCLSLQRPDSNKRPILLADGKDKRSIIEICKACQLGWEINEQRKRYNKQSLIFKKLGNEEIIVKLFLCINPYKEYIETNLGSAGSFYCPLKKKSNSINNCINSKCNHLFIQEKTLQLKQTEPFKEAIKELEDLR